MQLYLFYFKLFMIPEMVIIVNQISACLAYRSVTTFCVFILYFIWTIIPNKYCQKWGERGLDHTGVVYRRGGLKASAHYELIAMFFYDCSCLSYCLFFRLVAYKHLCLNWSKSVDEDSRCHVNEKWDFVK